MEVVVNRSGSSAGWVTNDSRGMNGGLGYLADVGHVSDKIHGCSVCTSDCIMQDQAMQGSEKLGWELSGGSLVEI